MYVWYGSISLVFSCRRSWARAADSDVSSACNCPRPDQLHCSSRVREIPSPGLVTAGKRCCLGTIRDVERQSESVCKCLGVVVVRSDLDRGRNNTAQLNTPRNGDLAAIGCSSPQGFRCVFTHSKRLETARLVR